MTTRLSIPAENAGARLDQYLTAHFEGHSRTEVQRWIADGLVEVHSGEKQEKVKPGLRLETGMAIDVRVPEGPAPAPDLLAETIPLAIVYEDENIIVVDKPAGMVVHPASGHSSGTLVNAILAHCPEIAGVGGERRPGIVHRLDKQTSGLIVVAKNDRAHRDLQAQFKARTVYKEYLALVEGGLEPADGRISAPVGRHPTDRKRQAILPTDAYSGESAGRDAVTDYFSLGRYSVRVGNAGRMTFTLLRIVLHTGRTHQIRVHLAWRKHPVLGDTLYGPKSPRIPLKRQFLHAHKLRIRIPMSGEEREFVSPLPADLSALLEKIG